MTELIRDIDIRPSARIIWFSSRDKYLWENRIQEISQEIQNLELKSVEIEQRDCATLTIAPEDILKYQNQYPSLIFRPLRLTRRFQGFAHKHEDPRSGEDYYVYYLIAKTVQAAQRFKVAYDKGDNASQGEFLGFPKCCCQFFDRVWKDGYFDPIYQMTDKKNPHPYSNPLLRYVGIRIGFHIPCSFHCEPTIRAAKDRLALLENKDIQVLLEALLSMPMTWDCLHGLAVVKTPLFWIEASSIPYAERHEINLPGKWEPRKE